MVSFVDRYLKRLVAAGKEKVVFNENGVAVLPRWKSPEGGSYGYNPADIVFHLSKLNGLLYEVTHGKHTNDIRLDGETLSAFSTLFGFYNLCSYFLYCQHEYITHIADKLSKNAFLSSEEQCEATTAKWLSKACELLKPFPEIDSWSDEFANFCTWADNRMSRYRGYNPSPDAQYWYGEKTGIVHGWGVAHSIEGDEYQRLVSFLKSLRMLCTTLAGYNQSSPDTETKQNESERVHEAADLMHIEIAGAVITLSKKEAALVAYADAKYKRKKVKVTTAHDMEVVAYLARQIDDDLYAAIFPRLPLQDGVTESVVVQCDNLKLGDDNRLTLFAGNVTEVFLEE